MIKRNLGEIKMENIAKKIFRNMQKEKLRQEQEEDLNFWLVSIGKKPIHKPVINQGIVNNTLEPLVCKEMAKKFDEMHKHTITIETNKNFSEMN